MVLESTMICIDNSEWMRNGDYTPSRFQAQADAVNLICGAKIQSNPENTVGVMTMAGKGVRVLVTPTSDLGKILACMHGLEVGSEANLAAAIQVAQLALKHRQNKRQQQRIIVFIGSPVKYEKKVLETIGKKLKKNNVALDIVDFGETDDEKPEKLEALISAVNSSDSSHIVHVPPGENALSDVLISTPIFTGEEGGSGFAASAAAAAATGATGYDFGVDPNVDPELALALRFSMEEERARQEAIAKKAAEESSGAENKDHASGSNSDAVMATSNASADDKRDQPKMSEKDKKIKSLVGMGFPEDEANMAITRCGVDTSVFVLIDSIHASEAAGDCYSRNLSDCEVKEQIKKKRKRYGGGAQGNRPPLDGSHDELMPLPKPMVGFNLPSDRLRSVNRRLPEQAIGPPFFYYENVAVAPKGIWTTILRFLYDIEPEFVDSKHVCAAARKRGYIHNLPIENRSPLLPLPPKTIFEAFPHYKKWWPSWDPRRQLNCLQTCVASARLTERIECALASSSNPPPLSIQKYVMDECRKWNLVWVGKNKVAPLEPDEVEFLLGFPRDHTRGVGKTERYKSLGNSFQVDTVAYHLSVLRDMFPNGMNVLSLFTGIGGGAVALHRLGIRMRAVVSVEISQVNRRILKGWWDQTQTGTLIEIPDVQSLTADRIESFIRRFGGFDLVIGGSPCNNLAVSNRHHHDGLEGEYSALFYHYFRILNTVKSVMARM